MASAGVHLGFATWMATRPDEPIVRKAATAELVFIETEPPPKPPEPTPEPPKPEPTPVVKPAPKPGPRVVKPPPSEAPTQVTAPTPPEDAPPSSDVPERLPPQDVPRQVVSLVPGTTSGFALSLDAGIGTTFDGVEVVNGGGLHGLEAPKNLVGDLTRETLGRGRVDRGLVHPYYSQLGKVLLKNWDADRVAKNGLKGLMEQTSANMKLYNEIWADRAAAYGGSGNPMGDATPTNNRRGAINDRIQGLTGVDLEQRKELSKAMREQFKATRRAVIRVVQDQNGKLTKVELVQPSQDAQVDKEALVDVRTAASRLPPPPPEALEGRTSISSLWSFELIISISPPVPTFSFEFDEALGFIDARLPLDRRIYKKVRLVSVE